MKNIIIGPSHVVRMQHAFITSSLKLNVPQPTFIGMGGAPTWSEVIFDKTASCYSPEDKISYILGDFRFGNNILADNVDLSQVKKIILMYIENLFLKIMII